MWGAKLRPPLLPCQSSSLIVEGRPSSPKGALHRLCVEGSTAAQGGWDNQFC